MTSRTILGALVLIAVPAAARADCAHLEFGSSRATLPWARAPQATDSILVHFEAADPIPASRPPSEHSSCLHCQQPKHGTPPTVAEQPTLRDLLPIQARITPPEGWGRRDEFTRSIYFHFDSCRVEHPPRT